MRKHRRLTRLEIKLLGQKLAVADIIATDNDFALAAKALIGVISMLLRSVVIFIRKIL